MERIGLIDVDSKLPNLALMKISSYHKAQGDQVEWYTPFEQYDIVYKSKIFSFTEDFGQWITNAKHIMGCNIPWNIQYGFLEWTVGGSVESETFELKICQVEKMMEFFNSHHLDYRGLIEKGVAIDATGLNIYKEDVK